MARYDTIIANGTLVVPFHGKIDADVGVRDGRIAAMGQLGQDEAGRRIDAKGLLVFPGLVDPHVHIGNYFPYRQDLAQESRSAAAGGVTTFITTLRAGTFGNPPPRYTDFFPGVREDLKGAPYVDYALHFTIPPVFDMDQLEASYQQFGVSSFKFYMPYKERPIDPGLDEGRILELMEGVATLKRPPLLMVHAESDDILRVKTAQVQATGLTGTVAWNAARPNIAEEVALRTVLLIARRTGVKMYIPHVTTAEGADVLRDEHARGNPVIGETCAHYLTLTERSDDVVGKVNPPIRKQADVDAMWAALADQTIVCVGTDHVARPAEMKQADIWNASLAFPSMETMMATVLTEALKRGFSPTLLAEVCAFNPARVFGLAPRKGNLAVGADADIALVDLQRERTIHGAELYSASKCTPWEGQTVRGWPVLTMVRGQVVYEDGQVIGPVGEYQPVYPDGAGVNRVKLESHLEKAACFERAFAELDPLADYELAIWAAMHAGTQYVNAVLHRRGVTIENEAYPSDRASNYVTRDGRGAWVEAPGPPGDIIHTHMPRLPERPDELAAAYEALAHIESLRPGHVRGGEPFGPGDAERLRSAFHTVRRTCRALLEAAP